MPLPFLTVTVIEPVGIVTVAEVVLPDVTEIALVEAVGGADRCRDRVARAPTGTPLKV